MVSRCIARFFGKKAPLYRVIPDWQKPIYRDPFDYPLRSIEEVRKEIAENPPNQRAVMKLSEYRDVPEGTLDLRNMVVKMEIDMRDWKLTEKQTQRLAFILGPRYKNSPKFKIVSRQYPTREQNIQKCLDILHELYMEAKRAP